MINVRGFELDTARDRFDILRVRAARVLLAVAGFVAPANVAGTARRDDGTVLGHVLAVADNEYAAGLTLAHAGYEVPRRFEDEGLL